LRTTWVMNRFGRGKKTSTAVRNNRKKAEINKRREEPRSIPQKTSKEEKPGFSEQRDQQKNKLKTLRKAKRHLEQIRKKTFKRAQFIIEPFNLVK
jgi:hypothetical protein